MTKVWCSLVRLLPVDLGVDFGVTAINIPRTYFTEVNERLSVAKYMTPFLASGGLA